MLYVNCLFNHFNTLFHLVVFCFVFKPFTGAPYFRLVIHPKLCQQSVSKEDIS